MKSIQSPERQFEAAKQRLYRYFRWKYLNGIEQAIDKQYATDYFFNTLFIDNPMIPRYSVYYFLLVSSYTHFCKLGSPKAVSTTLDEIPGLNSIASNALETALLHSAHYEGLEHIHWLYIEAIDDYNASLLEVLDKERRTLKASISRIILLLGLHSALEDLKNEFSPISDPGIGNEAEQEPEQFENPKLTRSQQVLIIYYLTQPLGIKHQKNVSKSAVALHSLLNIPYSQIVNSELYKKLLNPLSFSSEKATLQNLNVVRDFFEKWGAKSILEILDEDIRKITSNLK